MTLQTRKAKRPHTVLPMSAKPFYNVALVAAVAVFRFSTKSSAEARTKELLIMEYKEQLPTKLIDEDHPEHRSMNAMREQVFAQLKARDEQKARKSATTPEEAAQKAAIASGSSTLRNTLAFSGSRRPRQTDIETAPRQ